MKNLDLNALGVETMSMQEMKTTDGGIIAALAVGFLGALIYDICKDPKGSWDSFSEGMRDGFNR